MKKLLFLSGVAGSIFFGVSLIVLASSPFDITFPIPELGNCQNETECRSFCDNFANKDACIAFAQKHGLASEEQAEQVRALPSQGPGGCNSEVACRAYCEDTTNLQECLAFAQEHGLMDEEELERAREFAQGGPGGCTNPQACRLYCEDAGNHDECLDFAQEHNLIPPEELERARTLSKDGGPGGCKTPEACQAYCQDPSHAGECVDSAVKHGFLNKEDAARMKKLAVLGGPGGCKGKDECRAYCEDSIHQTECIAFAEENGFMTPEEAARARKFAGKEGPGGCRGEQCRDFCERSENSQACLEFAEREGLIPPEEVARARKFLAVSEQGGPGGCRGVECRDYCQDLSHQDECFAFAKGNGLLRAEDEQNFEAGRKLQQVVQASGGPGGCKSDEECRAYCTNALHAEECIAFGATHSGLPESQVRDMLRQFSEQKFAGPGEFRPHEDFRRFEEESRKKFEEFRALEGQFRGKEFGPPAGFGPSQGFPGAPAGAPGFAGPGGCSSPAECIKYCTEHKDECFSFGPPGQPGAKPGEGGIPPGREFDEGRSKFRPQLEQNLIREFRPEEIPQFQNEEQKREFFKQKFEEFRPPEGVRIPEGFKLPEGFKPSVPSVGETQPTTGERGIPPTLGDERAKACAAEGGVWDGNTCRPPQAPTQFFPETGAHEEGIQTQIFQQQVDQTQRQIQEQQIQQQIEQQTQQLQQLQQQLSPPPPPQQFLPPPQQFPTSGETSPPPPPPPPGASLLDALQSLLNSFFRR